MYPITAELFPWKLVNLSLGDSAIIVSGRTHTWKLFFNGFPSDSDAAGKEIHLRTSDLSSEVIKLAF